MKKVWLTTKEAAIYLGYSDRTMESFRAKDGAGPRFAKIPTGAIRYKSEWLDEWAESGKSQEES